MVEFGLQCCFCGKEIETIKADPVSLFLALEDDGSQQMWAHANCLCQHLHESVPLAIFDGKD
jgi:hypothetical protein